ADFVREPTLEFSCVAVRLDKTLSNGNVADTKGGIELVMIPLITRSSEKQKVFPEYFVPIKFNSEKVGLSFNDPNFGRVDLDNLSGEAVPNPIWDDPNRLALLAHLEKTYNHKSMPPQQNPNVHLRSNRPH